MIVTEKKPLQEILKNIGNEKNIFLIGCGECSTTCKTGGEKELNEIKEQLIAAGKNVTGFAIPKAPCIGSQIIMAQAINRKLIESADSVLVMSCGLGVQSVKENLRQKKGVHAGCDTLFISTLDRSGKVLTEMCSACGDCVLDLTGGICPVTRCAKGLLNGPCGGSDKGKCEVDKEKDCVWGLIYNELKEKGKISQMEKIQKPRKYSKQLKPRAKVLA
ncbi:MAG: 5,10-methylenetetrahydrofolate reductase [Candidatus Omnitrophica bacterium CG11_big_fil_rev_8_21_14_0_20_42_13]|uniref:5,10-methylenetetrahydrofolate reductase n=1 Tax=Candidatus Ghiorseimicrobium undicola TaxID=1974746 RepID=A0A2H0LXI4_9BACT|nr:MAG: 5,10-methylenetetrahydrofolate reductase [Candidatus Omnitrophica bacterium CG11_big_fil_rev_8_21_14_0_20_42_13]